MLEKATAYMLRNDSEYFQCDEYHPYISDIYQTKEENLESLVRERIDELIWFYEHTQYQQTKNYIQIIFASALSLGIAFEDKEIYKKLQIDDSVYIAGEKEIHHFLDLLHKETNQEFCRFRTSDLKYGGVSDDIYFRISSVGFNWYNLIWDLVYDNKEYISSITISRDNRAIDYNQGKCYKINGIEINHLPTNDFLMMKGSPIIEKHISSNSDLNSFIEQLYRGKSISQSANTLHPRYLLNMYKNVLREALDNDMSIKIVCEKNISRKELNKMKECSKKKINESLPMRNTIDLDKVQQELWEMCRDNDVELYFSEVRRIAGGQLGCSFEAVVDNYETVGNLHTVSDYSVSVKIVEEEALVSDDISTIADYIINTVHGKAIANQSQIHEDYNGSFDETSFYDAVSNFGVSRKKWIDFIENEAKKLIQKKKNVWKSEGWSAEDALIYGLERCDDVSYDGFDINRDEYDGLISSLEFYIDNSGLIESVNLNEKYYLTWYTEEEEGGPEEGGWSRRVWDVKKSYPFSSKEEAINYFNNEVVEDGDTVKEFEGGWRIKDGYGDEHLFEIETDATRGQSHEGPRTWDMYELGYKNPIPKFDNEGNRIDESIDSDKRSEKKKIKSKIWSLVRDFVDDDSDRYWRFDIETSLSSPEDVKLVGSVREIPNSAKYRFTIFDNEKDIASFYYDYHNDDNDYGCWYVVDPQGAVTESVSVGNHIYESADGSKDKLVIYKSLGEYKVTPKSNYESRVQDARKIRDAKDFESAREIIDYYKKYGWADSDDDFEIIDESLNENWCDEKLLELEVKGRDNWDQDDWETYAYCKNANAERDYQEMKDAEYEMEHPYDDIGDYEYWQMENEIPEDDFELPDVEFSDYSLVDRKTVDDSNGFTTEYSWYKDNNGHHVFVFGDSDLYRPEDGEWDWESDSDENAKEWFDNYNGFEEDEDSEEIW